MIGPFHNISQESGYPRDVNFDFSKLIALGKRSAVRKGEFIIVENEVCEGIYYIVNGAFRTFREENELEYTTGFTFAGDFETSPYSLFHSVPCKENIQAIIDSEVLFISKDSLDDIAKTDSSYYLGYILLLSAYIEILEERLHKQRSLTAEERYNYLKNKQPAEIDRIPLYYLASYLGISKERLSRIRTKQN